MFIAHARKRYSLTAGLFLLVPAISLIGGCGEDERQSASPGSSQQETHQHEDHAHDDHPHEDAAHDAEGPAAEPVEPGELDADAQAALDQIMASYLTVQQRLAEDEMEGVQAQLDELHDAAHVLGRSEVPGVREKARAVAEPVHHEPEDLDDARELFKVLSAAVIDLTGLVSPSDAVAPALYRAHCPMAEADWLQTDEEIVNPYMGQDMLRCGTIEQTAQASERE